MRRIEAEADASGWSYAQMMEMAGRGLAETIHDVYGGGQEQPGALALVGSGNNGGDALVALACLAEKGWKVAGYLVRARVGNDPLIQKVLSCGGRMVAMHDDEAFTELDRFLLSASVVIDGVVGTGARLPVEGEIARLLDHVRASVIRPPVVAVDCPSGVDCDSGDVAKVCIPASITVCMAAVKQGLMKMPAFRLCGKIQVVPIGLPEDVPSWQKIKREVVDANIVARILKPRPDDGHKGTFGTALMVAGSKNYPGAALLAGRAGLKIGAGLVTLASTERVQQLIAGNIPEATWILLPDQDGWLTGGGTEVIDRHIRRVTSLLIGPGFGQESCTGDFICGLIDRPLPAAVIDADGLKLMAQVEAWWAKLPRETVLTPHPGEMEALTGCSTELIQADRIATAEAYAARWGHVVVLKGAFSVIAAPDGRSSVIPVAANALAHAGTGDVLAGIITGLRAQKYPAYEAAVAGTWIHAQAGLRASEKIGHPAGVTAMDVVDHIAEILAWVW
jgi:NAD(P)H-hydrate epimerase